MPPPPAALDEAEVEERFAALRDTLESVVALLDPAAARRDAARFFVWARELPAPTTAGLEFERPLLALTLARRRDPWPLLVVVTSAESQRMRARG